MPTLCVTEGEDADVEDSGTEEKCECEEIQSPNKTEILTTKLRDTSLLHQCTKTSVESQSGSLDDMDDCSCSKSKEASKLASPGGTVQRRSRSPARVKRRKVKNSDSDVENI